MLSKRDVEELDSADPLRAFRDRFVGADDDLIYLDGNSLGRLPVASADRLFEVVHSQWAHGLVRSWESWISWPRTVGDLLGSLLLGAAAGQVVLSDSTSVNLYKLAAAALDLRPSRRTIVTDSGNFPTDRYILSGLAATSELRVVEVDGASLPDVVAALSDDVALVALSHVDYRTGALLPMASITEAAHSVGALVLWDLCHSVGAVPISLDDCAVDFAVGCTYKYVNAGPGAPAFLYVASGLHASARQPIWGWFGQQAQFEMGAVYSPVESIERFLVGTPAVLGIALVESGVRLLAEARLDRLRAKGIALTSLLISLADSWLAPLGFSVVSPRDDEKRGSHVSLRHDDAYRISQALIAHQVVPDFRRPDLVRFGCSPLTTSFSDVYEAMRRLRDIVSSGRHLDIEIPTRRVT